MTGGNTPKRRGAAVELEIARYLGGTRWAGSSSNPGRSGSDLNIPHTKLYADVKARNLGKMAATYGSFFAIPFHVKAMEVVIKGQAFTLTRLVWVRDMLAGQRFVVHAKAGPHRYSITPIRWLENMERTCPPDQYAAVILHAKGQRYAAAVVLMRSATFAAWTEAIRAEAGG